MFQKNITKKVITNLCQKNINVSQYKEHNYTSNTTTIKEKITKHITNTFYHLTTPYDTHY